MALLGVEEDSSFSTEAPVSPTDNLRQQLLAKYGLDNSAATASALSSGGGSTQDMIRKMVMEKMMGTTGSTPGSGNPLSSLAQQMLGQASSSSANGGSSLKQMLTQKILANQAQQSYSKKNTLHCGFDQILHGLKIRF